VSWKIVAALLLSACTPSPQPRARQDRAVKATARPGATPEDPFKLSQPAESGKLGLVGCSRCSPYDLPPAQETFLRGIDGSLQACESGDGKISKLWQALYTVPGLNIPWRHGVVFGGPKARRCMAKILKAVAWPEGWSATVKVADLGTTKLEDPALEAVQALTGRLSKCPRNGAGRVELDVTINDAHGSTMTTGYYSGSAKAEPCFRAAIRSYTLPTTWTASYSLKRDGVEQPMGL
jgi:hypothetical protein